MCFWGDHGCTTPVSPIHLPQVRERKIEWQDDTHNGNQSLFEQVEDHLVETMFYDQ